MRLLTAFIFLVLSIPASAELYPGYDITVEEVPTGQPGVFKFLLKGPDAYQAAAFTYPNLTELYERVLQENEAFKTAVNSVYDSNECDPDGTIKDIPGEDDLNHVFCGALNGVDSGNTVLWSFGRGGWAEAGASYKSFLTFTSAGTGHFTYMALELSTDVFVNAVNSMPGNQDPIVFELNVDMSHFRVVPEQQQSRILHI